MQHLMPGSFFASHVSDLLCTVGMQCPKPEDLVCVGSSGGPFLPRFVPASYQLTGRG